MVISLSISSSAERPARGSLDEVSIV